MNRREQMRLVDEGIAILEQLNSGAMSRKAEMSAVDRMLEIVELIGGDGKPVKQVSQNIKEAALAILLYGKGVSSVWGLAGDKMADARQKIMSLFAGFQVAKSKSGVNAILEQIKDNIGEHDFSSARESSIEDKIIDAWLMSTSQGIVFDVGAFKKGNQLNRDASDFGKQKDSYGFLGSYIGVDKASKFLKFSTEPKWAFAITESQKIKIGYTDGQKNVSWVDGDFDSPVLAYQALNSDSGYSLSPAQNLSPKDIFLKEANAKRQEIDESGFSGAAKKISAIIEDVARNIATVDEAKKRLELAIWETKNPLQSGEWRIVQSGQKFFFENMEYGSVVDTRKEGRSSDVFDPFRTSDGQYFTGLREAKAHELESYSKQRLINDGFMDGVKTEIEQYKPPKDYTQLLDGIALGDINVFDDSTKLKELVDATKESGGDDMPEDKKGLFIEAANAAGVQVLIGKGFPPLAA